MSDKKKLQKKNTSVAPTTVTTFSPAQKERIMRVGTRMEKTPPAPSCVVTEHNGATRCDITASNEDGQAALLEACGTVNMPFAEKLIEDLSGATCHASTTNKGLTLNANLSALAGIAPRDETEAMLAAQMIATHRAAMTLLGRAVRTEGLEAAQFNSGFAIRLLRTFTMQTEALQRLRGKGEQTVRVEHVTVNAGGQAIVGNVNPTGGVGVVTKSEDQPHAKNLDTKHLALASMPTMPCANEEKEPLPISRHAKR